MKKFTKILAASFTIVGTAHLLIGNIDYATLCAVLALSSEYSYDKLVKKEVK